MLTRMPRHRDLFQTQNPNSAMVLSMRIASTDLSYGGGAKAAASTELLEGSTKFRGNNSRTMHIPDSRDSSKQRSMELIHQLSNAAMKTAIHGDRGEISMASKLAQAVVEEKTEVANESGEKWWVDSGGRLHSLQRLLLEARWSFRQEVEWSCREQQVKDEQVLISPSTSSEVVRSGRPSARKRRLAARREEDGASSSVEESPAPFTSEGPESRKWSGRTRRTMKGFVDFYVKYAESHEMTEEDRLTLWEQIRSASELLRDYKRLHGKLGYEPSMHQLAETSGLPLRVVTRRMSQGVAARKRMIRTNMRLVVSIARRYENMGVEIADLIQEGTFGLVQGLEKFEVERGFKFSTYAYWWIFQAIIRALDKRGKIVRYPFHLCETIRKINRLKKKQQEERGEDGPLSVETLAKELNIPKSRIEYALQVSNYKLTSLDRHVPNRVSFEKGDPLETFMVDLNDENQPWKMAEKIEVKRELDRLLETKLNARERSLIRKRFGLDPKQTSPLSRYEIGRSCGLSSERVRQLENDAMSKLRACKDNLSIDYLLSSSYETIMW